MILESEKKGEYYILKSTTETGKEIIWAKVHQHFVERDDETIVFFWDLEREDD